MTTRRRGALALLLAALLVGSAITGSVGAAAQTTPPAAETSPDDAFVTDDGDVVLVYESDDEGDSGEAQIGMSTEEDLVYALFTDTVEEPPDVTWDFSALAQPTSLTANGSLAFPQPQFVDSFDLAITGQATSENARYDLDLALATTSQAGYGRFVQSITTDGEVTMGPDRFTATGTLDVRAAMPTGGQSSSSLTFREVSDGYELSVSQDRPLQTWQAEAWQNRSAAEATIRDQYVPFDEGDLAGNAAVSLDTYSVTNATDGGQRLDTSFTVTYTGMNESLRQLIGTQLAQAPGASEEAAQGVADELLAANVEEISYQVSSQGGSLSGNATVAVSDYEGLVLAYFEYAQSLQMEGMATGNLEQARARFEAQQAAGLEQRYTWSGEVQGAQDGSLTLDLAMDYRTTNWAAYVDELQSRDVPWSESRYALNGTSDGQQISLNGSMALEGEDLYEGALDQFGGMAAGGGMTTGVASGPDWGQALADAQPRTAKIEGSYDADGLRIEAGAAFGNITALRDVVVDQYGVPPADEVVGRYEAGNGTTHVRVNGAVSGDATESDVRALAYVGDDTTVHMPGTWDREFSAMDVEQARSFLGIAGTNGGIGPGFGAAVALLAFLAVALIATRRR